MRLLLTVLILAPWPSFAQGNDAPAPSSGGQESFWNRFWISVQGNFIRQQHPTFDAKYSGPNSFLPEREHATSRVETLYTGFQIARRLEILTDIESAGGAGLSGALGIAGFTNVDVVRNPTLSENPYVSRVMLHYTIALSKETTEATRNPLSLASTVPVRRLELRLGKMSTVDFFDLNSVGSDSHLQFMNWALVNNGAYDYAADTRGYSYGLVAEYFTKTWAARFGEMLMPTVANGVQLDWNISRARGENLEFEYHTAFLPNRLSVVRALGFVNHANMGSYRDAINGYLSGKDAVPDVTLYRKQGRVKYGFGLNGEQELTRLWRAFGRLGWNEGAKESYAYTEIDRTAEIGSDFRGKPWHRPQDKMGAAFVANGITGDHRRYLALGGQGFILGDGGLNYGLEKIFETYYTAHLWRGISLAIDYQHVTNPGYNQDRGPASVVSFRVHIEDAVPFDKFRKGN
ncbi:MAG TPA: carbohydrate porin [Candidatus Acidoferrales bacterium]|nr:carbohydrate porin [Candidatus Acidoferrales bacterium]